MQLVRRAGCASKIPQADLKRILGALPDLNDPNVILGTAAGDDAGVYVLPSGTLIVQTVDVFTPCVDDPYLFGQIAAANSLSDVYAMGGRPLTALSIVGFPIETVEDSILSEMLRGGLEKLTEAGCALIGGHSVNDEELKLGFAVTGVVERENLKARDTAQPGDMLVVTKPLGTGVVSFAAQIGRMSEEVLAEVGASMAELNRDAAELMTACSAHACTDITGFGLAGHLLEMARGSGVDVEVDLSALPVFAAAVECLEADVIPGAVERNQEYAMAWVEVDGGDVSAHLPILCDPQTSGGLMVALPASAATGYVEALRGRGHSAGSIVGRVIEKKDSRLESRIRVIHPRLEHRFGRKGLKERSMNEKIDNRSAAVAIRPDVSQQGDSCCAEGGAVSMSESGGTHDLDSAALFSDFMKQASADGRIDRRTKKLMAVALSVAQRCESCVRIQMQSALDMGISKEELDEAAWMGIAFAGAPAKMLYDQVRSATFRS
ncbi:MAG: selenide, water dikinase SelD, partial [Candidatus Sumerlaeota bacterium]|nr:selenide, water dikinase SelD [Candidatus Sumerlaeota bacterium]